MGRPNGLHVGEAFGLEEEVAGGPAVISSGVDPAACSHLHIHEASCPIQVPSLTLMIP